MLTVKDVCSTITIKPPTVDLDATISVVVNELVANPMARSVYVLGPRGKVRGVIPVIYLLKIFGYDFYGLIGAGSQFAREVGVLSGRTAREIMLEPLTVQLETTLEDALKLMVENEIQEVPVVDSEGNISGDLNSLEILKALNELKEKPE